MKLLSKNSIVAMFIVYFVFFFSGSTVAHAATTPSLGTASPYGIVSSTYTNSLNAGLETRITGNVCYTTPPGTAPISISGATVVPCPPSVGVDQASALANLNGQACVSLGAGAITLNAVIIGANPAGTFPPGCYSSGGAMLITLGTTVTLNATAPGGVGSSWIFRSGGGLTTGADSIVVLSNGASACDVFWTPTGAVNIGANASTSATPTFVGTIIADALGSTGIGLGHFVNLLGRTLAFGHTVTTDSNTIVVPPACTTATSSGGGGPLVASIPLTPPLINVTKIPTPLDLPGGPGSVTYNYTVLNIGVVPMSNVTVTDNSCVPVSFVSGDTNGNSLLDVNEAWMYRCTTIVPQTTTNTVVASGQANGFTAVDTANATVVVGAALIPPLIHLVKVPSRFVLPVPGGAVTYNYTVTNPGTVPLANVSITDDRCTGLPGRVVGHPGDLNKNDLLESNESWSFVCQTNIAQTTTNTATAEGSANGFTARDSAAATVAVSPALTNNFSLPQTGFPPEQKSTPWNIIVPAGILGILFSLYLARKKLTI